VVSMVYIFLADGFEEIEALTVVDVLRRGDVDIKLVGLDGKTEATGRSSITVKTDMTIKDIDKKSIEMIVLPGGAGTSLLENDIEVGNIIDFCCDKKLWIAAICAAPSILGKRGLLKDNRATCYPGFEKYLNNSKISRDSVVVSSNFITSKGPGTSFDFAFEILSVLKGDEIAKRIKEDMLLLCAHS
jgi:protein deglycase